MCAEPIGPSRKVSGVQPAQVLNAWCTAWRHMAGETSALNS